MLTVQQARQAKIITDPKKLPEFLKKNLRSVLAKKSITRIHMIKHKDKWGSKRYHAVLQYHLTLDNNGQEEKQDIMCVANAEEPRKNAFKAMHFLYTHGFATGHYQIPKPYHYMPSIKAMFYDAAMGENLLQMINKKSRRVYKSLDMAVGWLNKLHSMKVTNKQNFNPKNARLTTIPPGLRYVANELPGYHAPMARKAHHLYTQLIAAEKQNEVHATKLVHGDFHPENLIFDPKQRSVVHVIDFADMSIADPARDVGTFLQQLHFMTLPTPYNTTRLQKQFLHTYLTLRHLKRTPGFVSRINLYQSWTALRTAIFFTTALEDNKSAKPILADAEAYFNLSQQTNNTRISI